MNTATRLGNMSFAGALALTLAACGSSDTAEITSDADGMPTGDTGWTMERAGDTLLMQRRLDQLTLSYTLEKKREGVEGTVTARAVPCLNGEGDKSASESFTPMGFDDASALADIRERLAGVVIEVDDQCDLPQDLVDEIASGFDGLYFRSASDRAAISGQ